MNKDILLTELEIVEIKDLAEKARKSFGVYDVPIANDLFMLLEQGALRFASIRSQQSENPIQMRISRDLNHKRVHSPLLAA